MLNNLLPKRAKSKSEEVSAARSENSMIMSAMGLPLIFYLRESMPKSPDMITEEV
jgi:hypothetical protein